MEYVTTEQLISSITDCKCYGFRQARRFSSKKLLVLDTYYNTFKHFFEGYDVKLYNIVSIKKAVNLKNRNHRINVICL